MRVPFPFAVAALGALALAHEAAGQGPTLVRVSIDSAGAQGNGDSRTCALSADGRWVAFVSNADNLAAGDDNGFVDVYVHDRETGTTERVSLGDGGAEPEDDCISPAMSGDGRLVAFQSDADNLVAGDGNAFGDIFVRDRQLGTTTRVSLGTHDQEANLPCVEPALSADGRIVAFQSYATNLGSGQSVGLQDVFVRDLSAGMTTCISLAWNGGGANHTSWAPVLSADGRFVAFYSQASNLVPDDQNGAHDVFVHDRQTGLTELVSVNSEERPGKGPSLQCRISASGRFVAFSSYALNLTPDDNNSDADVFVRDRKLGTTELISQSTLGRIGADQSNCSAISGDGRWVLFHSPAPNLVPGDDNLSTDIFVRDRLLGVTTRLNMGLHATEADDTSQSPAIASNAPVVAFESHAQNLVAGDSNAAADVFVHVME